MFSPVLADDAKAFFKDRAMGKFKYLDNRACRARLPDGQAVHRRRRLPVHDADVGADRMKFDLSELPNLMAYKARVAARPKVQEAMTKEGLMKAA